MGEYRIRRGDTRSGGRHVRDQNQGGSQRLSAGDERKPPRKRSNGPFPGTLGGSSKRLNSKLGSAVTKLNPLSRTLSRAGEVVARQPH